jgi:hypothetical protein
MGGLIRKCFCVFSKARALADQSPGGPSNILPGILFFSGLAGGATYVSQMLQNRTPKEKKSWLSSGWSPLTVMSDPDYERILKERVLKLDADIAIIDENIAALRALEEQRSAQQANSNAPKLG